MRHGAVSLAHSALHFHGATHGIHYIGEFDAKFRRITVAGSGEIQDQAGRPRRERTKVGHGLCDHLDVALKFNLHVVGVVVEACSHAFDVLGCVSHSGFLWRCDAFRSGCLVA